MSHLYIQEKSYAVRLRLQPPNAMLVCSAQIAPVTYIPGITDSVSQQQVTQTIGIL
jgi:hypothetical protein